MTFHKKTSRSCQENGSLGIRLFKLLGTQDVKKMIVWAQLSKFLNWGLKTPRK